MDANADKDADNVAGSDAGSDVDGSAADGIDLEALTVDRVYDGGELDCGSGLALLIREQMMQVPAGGVLEVRSRDATVCDDLPPWCRLSGHVYLGRMPGQATMRFFVRRGIGGGAGGASGGATGCEAAALQEDKDRAREYEWRTRVRGTGHLQATAYCRNFSFKVGAPASFEEKDAHPSAVEYLAGAIGAELAVLYSDACARAGAEVDDIELTVKLALHDPLATLEAGRGDPSVRQIDVKCFASSMAAETGLRAAWEGALARAPLLSTLRKTAQVETRLAIV